MEGLRRVLLASALASVAASCGGEPPPPEPVDPLAWTSVPPARRRGPYDLLPALEAVLELPFAGDAGPDFAPSPDATPRVARYVVNVERDRLAEEAGLYFRGRLWPFSREERERWRALDNLRTELTSLRADPRLLEGSQFCVLLRADRNTRWRDVADVAAVTADPAVAVARLDLAARSRSPWADGRVEGTPVESPDPAPNSIDVRWSMELHGGAAPPEVLAQLGGRVLRFPPNVTYAVGFELDRVNAAWRDVLATFRDARRAGTTVATMEVADDVAWAYVAQTLGLLIAADVREVRLPDLPAYRLSTPPPDSGPDSALPMTHDVPRALALAIGAGSACLLYALALLAGRRRRRAAGGATEGR